MAVYIERGALIEAIKQNPIIRRSVLTFSNAKQVIEAAPAVDVSPVVHGYWETSDIPCERFKCSVCGGGCWYYDYQGDVAKSRFCPNCGAKMDMEDNNEADL